MSEHYRAVQAIGVGEIRLTELERQAPPAGHVRIRVEACGICHTDAATVAGVFPIDFPRVPGHEAVGRIDAVGDGVVGWSVGDRVGVGYLGGQCNHCANCRRGDFVNCTDQPMTGVHVDGGWAESMIARETGLIRIPEELGSLDAAPLLCAGLTTFNGLLAAHARPGALVAVGGLGGLGHLAVQYARRMGYRVVAIARGPEKAEFAAELGAHEYIDSLAADPAAELTARGGAAAIIATAANAEANARLIPGLAAGGRIIVLGIGDDPTLPLHVSGLDLLFGEREVAGRLTGNAADGEDALAFSVLQDVRPKIEVVGLAEAPAAYERMLSGQARLRMVLDMSR